MRTSNRELILSMIKKNKSVGVSAIVEHIGITRQAVHRHLRILEKLGSIHKVGSGPRAKYSPQPVRPLDDHVCKPLKQVFKQLPDIELVTLFGSVARGTSTPNSDIDVMVWIRGSSGMTRSELWDFYDKHMEDFPWKDRVSLITVKLRPELQLNTLLLDLPEEHRVIFDRNKWFHSIKTAVLQWRQQQKAQKIPSFGGTHAWSYSDQKKKLQEIDFTLRLNNVA